MADLTEFSASEAGSGSVSSPSASSSLSPPPIQQPPGGALRCCCGQTGCVYLQHNCTVLESVENDVRTAAKLGQSLLERHEAYMADAERDRAELQQRIGQLEMDKKELEAENAKKIQENRALLDQLEALNATVADSDTHIKMLEATLQSSQMIIRQLEGAAERAEGMERHLAALEAEQAALQNSLVTSESEARSAVQRWKRAERGIADLQFQLEKMEREAREEKERHLEIISRMERQRAVEKELSTAAGRLKGAAAAKSLHETKAAGSTVVNHFVRDLLQDNANLQLGMAELRDMLMTSNDEIQMLRDQLMFHQPLIESTDSATSTLRAELGTDLVAGSPEEAGIGGMARDVSSGDDASAVPASAASPHLMRHRPTVSQELHIHHHYHHISNKKPETKKPKKKRLSLTPGIFTPPAVLSLPSTPRARSALSSRQEALSATPGSSPPRLMSRDSVATGMSGPSNRWSVFSDQPSDFGMSSIPSSPQTDPRNSVFDRTVFSDLYSGPASPTTSLDPLSPTWRAGSRMPSLDGSLACGLPPAALALASSLSVAGSPRQPAPILEDSKHGPRAREESSVQGDGERSDTTSAEDAPDSDVTSSATSTADESAPSEGATPTATPPPLPPPLSICDGLPHDGNDYDHAGDDDEARQGTTPTYTPPVRTGGPPRPLRRTVSHESIISLQGGLDIHTLKARPSQLALRPLGTALADTGLSSVTARPVISRGCPDIVKSNSLLRESLSLGMPTTSRTPGGRTVSSPVAPMASMSATSSRTSAAASLSSASPSASPAAASLAGLASARGLGKFVGWRPWGSGSGSSSGSGRSASASTPAAAATVAVPAAAAVATPAVTALAPAAPVSAPAVSEDVSTAAAPAVTVDKGGAGALAAPTMPANSATPTTPAAPTTPARDLPQSSGSRSGGKKDATTPSRTRPGQGTATKALQDLAMLRSPGINQPGAIPGFFEYWAAHQRRGVPSKVHADVVDEEALREGLMGG